ncbi:hypothetical protein FVEG_02043 [Fusarium verticillioides 7600]|uniref:Uncharacterized protein n=1 Tax=Gibberella moniliformis (strain M3125 / FGSC 7600) TaxID=334819 RepID=W7M2A7_GIBM7|nr:hypothetical protein FVEG_02043 [Fusarium verticillioides 7600]EWG39032.1 hypothetical protein FVEG_02043 [Fusarium verticillioides 7600]
MHPASQNAGLDAEPDAGGEGRKRKPNAAEGYDPCCWPRTWSRVEAAIAEGLQVVYVLHTKIVVGLSYAGVWCSSSRSLKPAAAEHLYQATIYTRLLLIIICLSVIQIPAFA